MVVLGCAAIGVSVSSVAVFGPRPQSISDFILPILVPLIPAVVATMYFLMSPVGIERNIGGLVDRSPQLTGPTVWRFRDTGIEIVTEQSNATLAWSVFGSVVETEQHFLLIQSANPVFYYFIGKGAVRAANAESELRVLFASKLGTIKDEIKLKKYTLPVLEVSGVGLLVALAVVFWLALAWMVMR